MHLQLLEDFHRQGKGILGRVSDEHLQRLARRLAEADKVFVLGIGHSGMFGRIFCMKLNHVGVRAYSVFDEVNPPFGKGDLFVAISQSGETGTVLALVDKAKKLGGEVLGVTSGEASTLAGRADHLLVLQKYDQSAGIGALGFLGDSRSQNVLGSLFGFTIYVVFYALAGMIAGIRGETAGSIDQRHATLQ
ncbi:MAG: SIS domain-containing protein [Spirochaetota bacterium]